MILDPTDQTIRDQGFNFVPFNRYLASPFQMPESQTVASPISGTGITTLPMNMGGGGGGTYTGGISDLSTDFFNTTSDRQNRLTELNRPLAEAQFPSFRESYGTATLSDGRVISNIENAQKLYNQASGYISSGMDPNTVGASNFSYKGITNPTIAEIQSMAGDQIQDFQEKYRTGQLGPSYIEAEEPTIGRKISDAFYSLPGLNKPQSADQIIAEGYTGTDNLPGIIGMVLGSMDKYGSLPRGDQAFIARNMGYTGPTVFGDNSSGLSKDIFGKNTRSAFGNYAEAVGDEVSNLSESLSSTGAIGGKKAYQGATFNEATGMFEADDDSPEAQAAALKANNMTKMVRARFSFYTNQTKQRDLDRQAAIEAEAAASRAESQRQYDPAIHGPNNYGLDSSGKQSFDSGQGFGIGSDGGPVSNKTGKGRTGFMMGGLTDLVDIYD